MPDDGVIKVADHMGRTLQLRHELEFLDHVLHNAAEVRNDRGVVKQFCSGTIQLALILRNGHNFDCRLVGDAEIDPMRFKDLSVAPLAEQPDKLPIFKYRIADCVNSVHDRSSSRVYFGQILPGSWREYPYAFLCPVPPCRQFRPEKLMKMHAGRSKTRRFRHAPFFFFPIFSFFIISSVPMVRNKKMRKVRPPDRGR